MTMTPQHVAKGTQLNEASSKGSDQVGTTIDLSQGMQSQKRQEENFQIQLTGSPSEPSGRFYIGQSSV
jgi:hypothetical protein